MEAGYTCPFARLDQWAADAEATAAASDLTTFLVEWLRPQLAIRNEVGHQHLGPAAARAFCQLLTRRYIHGSLILTSNRDFESWSEFLGDEVLAAAVVDRFLHFATVFTQSGESYRLQDAKRRRARGN